jgi:putative tryptophan/tyrosine transport system substrate-binding protein
MRRREFIAGLGGAVVWPVAARAQQPERMRRVGALMNVAESDPEGQARAALLRETLEKLGWTVGRNLAIDHRWGVGDLEQTQAAAADLVRSAPDVILANGGPALAHLRQATRTIPIVFLVVSEPVALGFVASLARPGGNITGFTNLESTIGAKLLELLKEMAPRVTRFAVMFNPDTSTIGAQLSRSAETAAQKFAVELVDAQVRQPADIETTIAMLSRDQHGGLIVAPDSFTQNRRKLVLDLAARHQLPAIYPYRYYAADGGLMSYGVDSIAQYRQAAGYVDRILRGDKPADLPVQQPTKFELVINLKTAKALGLAVPQTLLITADEVIQ